MLAGALRRSLEAVPGRKIARGRASGDDYIETGIHRDPRRQINPVAAQKSRVKQLRTSAGRRINLGDEHVRRAD
jgi:hypothetical protein